MNGSGKLLSSQGQIVYEGGFAGNEFDGFGILHHIRDGAVLRYEGLFKNSLKHGIGKLYYRNGDVFLGEFRQDQIEGVGILITGKGISNYGIWKGGVLQKNSLS